MKRLWMAILTAALFTLAAAAQTDAQASGSSSTGVQAGQANASASSNTSAAAGAETSRKHGQSGATANGSSDTSATVNGNSLNTASAGSLAAGTTIPAILSKPVDARKAKSGDQVMAKTTQDVRSDSGVMIPRGSRIVGHVTDAKAKAKGDSESALGIAFDRAILRDGHELPLNASIRALAASANSASSMGDDSLGGASSSSLGGDMTATAPAARAGGGVLGGAANTVGGAAGTVGNTAGGTVSGVGNTTANVGANAGGAVNGTTRGAAGQLTAQSQGVIGLNGLSLSSAATNSASGSVITSTGKDVKLDSGTQMLLQVNQ